jgi:hypothetical protein
MSLLFLALLSAAGGPVPAAPPSAPNEGVEIAQMTIQQRIVVRVPLAPMPAAPPVPIRWVEKKGPKCVGLSSVAGFAVRGPQVVDLFLRDGQRVRTRLEKQCSSLDLGYGFYVKPHADGRICRDRDVLHARTGGQCEVDSFSNLVPER